jgi:ABC-type molybdenum transport system ATPase subunit/photorepair protein PhrA
MWKGIWRRLIFTWRVHDERVHGLDQTLARHCLVAITRIAARAIQRSALVPAHHADAVAAFLAYAHELGNAHAVCFG